MLSSILYLLYRMWWLIGSYNRKLSSRTCRFGRNPKQWKSSLESKATVYRDFLAAFGDGDQSAIASESSLKAPAKKRRRREKITGHIIGSHSSPTSLQSAKEKLSSGDRRRSSSGSRAVEFLARKSFTRNNTKAQRASEPDTKKSSASELADLALKPKLSQGDVQKLFDPRTLGDRKQHGIPSLRKHKRW